MKLSGQVMNASVEDRELTSKDGVRRMSKVSHVLMSCGEVGKEFEIVNVRCYDAKWPLPAIGKSWTTPPVRRYENFDGQVADVTVREVA